MLLFLFCSIQYKVWSLYISWLMIFPGTCLGQLLELQLANRELQASSRHAHFHMPREKIPSTPRRIQLSARVFKHALQALNLIIAYVQVDQSHIFQVLRFPSVLLDEIHNRCMVLFGDQAEHLTAKRCFINTSNIVFQTGTFWTDKDCVNNETICHTAMRTEQCSKICIFPCIIAVHSSEKT